MTVLALAAAFCGAVVYELTVRDAPMEWVLGSIVGVLALAFATWMVLRIVVAPLANDHAALQPDPHPQAAGGCPVPHGGMQVILGQTRVVGIPAGSFTPFRVGVCSGPTMTRTPRGLAIDAFGYDGDGSVVYQIKNNQFTLIEGEYLHLHRAGRSTLAVYDKAESEVVYVRYLSTDVVRVRGRFACADATPVTIKDDRLEFPAGQIPLPPCVPLKAKNVLNLKPQIQ